MRARTWLIALAVGGALALGIVLLREPPSVRGNNVVLIVVDKLVLGKKPYREELFDLVRDPGERRSLLGRAEDDGAFSGLAGEIAATYNGYARASFERSVADPDHALIKGLAALVAGDVPSKLPVLVEIEADSVFVPSLHGGNDWRELGVFVSSVCFEG